MYDSKIKVSDLIDDVKAEFDGERNVSDSKYRYWYESLIQLLYSEVIRDIRESTATITFEDNRAYMKLDDIKVSDERLGTPRVEDIVSVRINGYELSFAGSVDGSELRNSYWFSGDGISIWSDYGSGDAEITVRYVARPKQTATSVKYIVGELQNKYVNIIDVTNTGDSVSSYKAEFEIHTDVQNIKSVKVVYADTVEDVTYTYTYTDGVIKFFALQKTQSFGDNDVDIYGETYEEWLAKQSIIAVIDCKVSNEINDTVPLPYEFVELVKCKLRGEAYKVINDDGVAAKWLAEYDVLLENFKTYIEIHRSKYGR